MAAGTPRDHAWEPPPVQLAFEICQCWRGGLPQVSTLPEEKGKGWPGQGDVGGAVWRLLLSLTQTRAVVTAGNATLERACYTQAEGPTCLFLAPRGLLSPWQANSCAPRGGRVRSGGEGGWEVQPYTLPSLPPPHAHQMVPSP